MFAIPMNIRDWHPAALAAMVVSITIAGAAVAYFVPLGLLMIGITIVILATLLVDRMAVWLFWALPYMIVNLPTGAFTLKLPEVTAYIFAFAALVRAVIRRDKWYMPPPTPAVLCFLAITLIATACEPSAAVPFLGAMKPTDRNAPAFRSIGIIIWMALSWLVVVAVYNVVGRSRSMFKKCVVTHVLSAGLASAFSFAIFVLSFCGIHIENIGGGGRTRDLVKETSDFFRLAGVAYEPLFLAFYMLTVLPLTVVILLYRPNWLPRKITALCLGLQSLAFLLTFSAGGTAGLIVIAIMLIVLLRNIELEPRLKRQIRVAGTVVGVTLVFSTIVVGGLLAALGRVFNKIGHATTSSRAGEWTVGVAEFLDHPILGVGPGMSHYHFPQYEPDMNQQTSVGIEEVNDIVLGTLGETGIIGFVALGLTVLAGLRALGSKIFSYGPERVPVLTALTASLIGCAIQTLAMNFGVLSLIYFTGLLALTTAAYRVEATFGKNGEIVKPAA